jgi:hypothetical protein
MESKIKNLIREHVKNMRRSYWWLGENEDVVKKIMKIIKEKA